MVRVLWVALVASLLLASGAWAAVGCTIYTRSSDGDDADDGSTWALANATLVGSLADWGTSDVICVENGSHTETQASSMTLSATGDTDSIQVPILSVSDADDSYSPATDCQVSVTGGADITFSGHFSVYGVEFCTNDNVFMNQAADTSWRSVDVNFTFTSGSAIFALAAVPAGGVSYFRGGQIDCTHGNGCYLQSDDTGPVVLEGVTFAGNAASGGMFQAQGGGPAYYICRGCDLSALSGETMADVSTAGGSSYTLELIGSLLPATVTIHDSGFDTSVNQTVFVSGTDDATGNESFRQELYQFDGDITTDTSVFRASGLTFTEGTTQATLKFEPASHVSEYEPLCSWPVATAWINSTGSTTFTTELVENFTSALTLAEVWQEIFYLGTSSSPDWSLDVGQSVGSTTALTASGGDLGDWTAEPSGSRDVKLETTVTVNKAGIYQVRYCVGAFESGKVVHFDKTSVS